MIFLCLFSGSTDQPHQQLYLECIHYQVKIKLKNIKVFIYPYNSWMLQHAKLTFDKTLNTKIYQTPPPELSCNVSQQHMLLSNLTKIRNWHKLISRREFVNHKLSQIKLFWTCRVFSTFWWKTLEFRTGVLFSQIKCCVTLYTPYRSGSQPFLAYDPISSSENICDLKH